jgi:hypothetical protein
MSIHRMESGGRNDHAIEWRSFGLRCICYWHLADMQRALIHVRFRGVKRTSAFKPQGPPMTQSGHQPASRVAVAKRFQPLSKQSF